MFYASSERGRRKLNVRSAGRDRIEKEKEDAKKLKTSWPTLPCCDAMRAGLACECCEVVDA